jgi:hypothetical protein
MTSDAKSIFGEDASKTISWKEGRPTCYVSVFPLLRGVDGQEKHFTTVENIPKEARFPIIDRK